MTTTYLPLQAAVVLAHALVAHVADELGLRVIFLKGPIATMQGLRDSTYISGDVDALCEPNRQDELVAALETRGWGARLQSEAATRFTTHSITLVHPDWPCDIDVHTRFPGFLAAPSMVFEELWANCETFELADVAVRAPNYRTQGLILLLHGLRSPGLPKNRSEIADARTRFLEMTPMDRDGVLGTVHATGAGEVVHDFFADLGVALPLPPSPSAEYLKWRLITQPSRTEGWAMAISQARGTERWHLFYRAVFPAREHLIIDHPAAAESRRAFARAHLTRWMRAARLAPGAIHNVVLARRARNQLPVAPVAQVHGGPTHPMGESDSGVAVNLGAGPEAAAADVAHSTPTATHRVQPLGASSPVAMYAARDDGPDADAAYILPLESRATQVPLRVNAVGRELLSLLLEREGDLDRTVRDAAAVFERPPEELRTAICDFRHEMVRLGVLSG